MKMAVSSDNDISIRLFIMMVHFLLIIYLHLIAKNVVKNTEIIFDNHLTEKYNEYLQYTCIYNDPIRLFQLVSKYPALTFNIAFIKNDFEFGGRFIQL